MSKFLDTSLAFIKLLPRDFARGPRSLAFSQFPLHTAADRHVPRLSVALRYAFAVGRKAIQGELAKLKTAGGPGSGNFGHRGRPGQIGGSAPDVGAGLGEGKRDDPRLWTRVYEPAKTDKKFMRGGFTMYFSRGDESSWSNEITVVDEKKKVIGSLSFGLHMLRESKSSLEGSVEVHPEYRRRGMATEMYDLAEELTGRKFEPAVSQSRRGEAFWRARRMRSASRASDAMHEALRTVGGPGSGNFGHAGRPGQVGGSSGRRTTYATNDVLPRYTGQYPSDHVSGIQEVPLDQITPTETKVNEQVVQSMMKAIEHGDPLPAIVVQFSHDMPDGRDAVVISDGHHRYEAAKRLGLTHIPTRVVVDEDDWPKVKKAGGLEIKGAVRFLSATNASRASDLRTTGGPGSGNFGHAGRPGQVGGSSSYRSIRPGQVPSSATNFYHGTSRGALDNILAEGLLSSKAGEQWPQARRGVYISESFASAKSWAKTTVENSPTPIDAVLLTVEIPKEARGNLYHDSNSTDKNDRFFRGDIKPEWIKLYEIIPSNLKGLSEAVAEDAKQIYVAVIFDETGQLRSASRATDLASRASDAMREALESVLPATLAKVLAAGGGVAAEGLRELRTAGGPGSGNFGHAGRPGQVGGSSGGGGGGFGISDLPSAGSNLDTSELEAMSEYSFFQRESSKWTRGVDAEARQNAYDYATRDFPELGRKLRETYFGKKDSELPEQVSVYRVGFSHTGLTSYFPNEGGARAYQERFETGSLERVIFDPRNLIPSESGSGEVWGEADLAIRHDKLQDLRAAADALFKFTFNAKNPAVIKWARKHAAELVTQITETTRDRIRLAVEELQEEGDFDFAHDRIMAAVGDEARADLIARHETMLAANEGQRQGWDQAVDKGLLTGDERRVWIITPDERLCLICAELEDKTAPLRGEYPGGYEGPPAHVQCRCTEGIA